MEDVKDKERSRDKRLQNTYGITLAQYNAILAAQGGEVRCVWATRDGLHCEFECGSQAL